MKDYRSIKYMCHRRRHVKAVLNRVRLSQIVENIKPQTSTATLLTSLSVTHVIVTGDKTFVDHRCQP